MLIDWLSLNLPTNYLDLELVREWQNKQARVLKVKPGGVNYGVDDSGNFMFIDRDGGLEWETSSWDSVRSDSHQLAFQVTANHIRIQGSPARIMGDGDNVFSCGASAALDLVGCFHRMADFISTHTGIPLDRNPAHWTLTRVDVTENLFLGSLPLVRQALSILRDCEGGRYRVSQQAGDTVYWSHRSRLRSGKAYAKGAEIAQKMVKKGKQHIEQNSRDYSIEEIAAASGLLRLELKLGAQFWRERVGQPWHQIRPDFLEHEWKSYFSRMIGGAEVKNDDDIFERLLQVVELDKPPVKTWFWVGRPRQTQAKAAYALWTLIKSEGWEKAKYRTAKATWYRNKGFLEKAGLSDADISTGNIVQFRQKIIEAQPVRNWAELTQLFYQRAA